MKKYYLLPLFLCLFSLYGLKAQVYLGGTFAIEANGSNTEDLSSNEFESNSFRFDIYPKVGFYLNDNFILGAYVGFSTYSSSYLSDSHESENKENSFSIGPFMRYNIDLTERLFLINQISAHFGYSLFNDITYWEDSDDRYWNGNGFSTGVGYNPMIGFSVTEKLMLELGIGYLGYTYSKNIGENYYEDSSGNTHSKEEDTGKRSSFRVNYNRLSFSLAYKF